MNRPAPSFTSKATSVTAGSVARRETRATTGVAGTLRALDVRPSRRLGQNFLSDPRVAERIAALALEGDDAAAPGASAPPAPGPILEIGPGLGALTEHLAASGRPFVAVELDLRLAEHVESLLRPYPNARVVRGDILDQGLDALLPGSEPVTVVANLPYVITSPAIA